MPKRRQRESAQGPRRRQGRRGPDPGAACLFVLVFLMPLAGAAIGAAGPATEPTATVTYTFHGLIPTPEPGDPASRPNRFVGTEAWCGGGTLIIDADRQGISFSEPEDERGCRRAHVRVPWPAEATRAEVSFQADRQWSVRGTTPTDAPPQRFEQTILLGDAANAAGAGPHQVEEVFAADSGAAPLAEHTFLFDVSAVEEPIFYWMFADQGASAELVHAPGGVAWRATVHSIRIQTPGLPAPLAQAGSERAIEGKEQAADQFRVWTLPAERQAIGARAVRLDVHVPAGHEWVGLFAPDGTRLHPNATEEAAGGGRLLRFGPESFAAKGPGEYRLHTTVRTPVAITPLLVPLALVLFALPFVPNLDVVRLGRAAEFRPSRRYVPISVGVIGGWMVVLTLVVATGRLPLVSHWPPGTFGIGIYAGLGLVIATSVAWWLLARREIVQAVQAQAETIAQRSHELEQFMASVTHDLKSPLVALDWLARDLQEELAARGADPEMADSIRRIRRNVGGMDALVRDLLELQRVELEGDDLGQRTEVQAVLDDVLDQARDLADARGARVDVAALDVPALCVAPARLHQVLSNLVGNAIKYGRPNGGQVVVAVLRRGDGGCRLEVRDDGPGIPPDERDEVLGLFQRGRGAHAAGIEGTGIGLAMVARQSRRWGGQIEIGEAPEGGACVAIDLPAARNAG